MADTSAMAGRAGYARDRTSRRTYDSKTPSPARKERPQCPGHRAQRGNGRDRGHLLVTDCGPLPARSRCTTSRGNDGDHRAAPGPAREAQGRRRAAEKTITVRAEYARRAGVRDCTRTSATAAPPLLATRACLENPPRPPVQACASTIGCTPYVDRKPRLDRRRPATWARWKPGSPHMNPNKPPGSGPA